jgi:hypothetical protein
MRRAFSGGPGRAAPSRAAAILAALAIVATLAAACGPGPATPSAREVPIGPTPWPSGTTGQYGLHIDPSLLGLLPRNVSANPLVEDADNEMAALTDPNLAKTFDNYAAASIGFIGDANWLQLVVGHLRPDYQDSDVYTSWVAEYATGACSQADGVSSTSQTTINDWVVDVSTCAGGPIVYTLSLGNGTILSMFGLGPKDLGRMLIGALY